MCGNSDEAPKWSDYQIEFKETGEQFHLVEGSKMKDIKVFAGKVGYPTRKIL